MFASRSGLFALVLLSLIAFSTGCSKEPEDLSQRAEQALEAARVAGAPEFAPEAFREADDALVRAKAESAAQAKRFALTRRYTTAKSLYAEALRAANRAEELAAEGRTRAHDDADALLVAVQQQVSDARALLDSEKGRQLLAAARTGPALEQLRTEVGDLERTLSSIREAIDASDYSEALRMGMAARSQAELVESEVAEVMATGRPPQRRK